MDTTLRFSRAIRTAAATAALALTAGLIGTIGTPTATAANWVPGIETVSELGLPTGARVAVQPNGDAVAVWRINNGSHYDIRAAERRVGGQWSDSLILSTTSYDSITPDITIGPAGDVVASWRTSIEGVSVLYAARMYRVNGQANWSEFKLTLDGESAFDPKLAVDGHGTIFAAWRSSADLLRSAIVPTSDVVDRDVMSFETPNSLDIAATPAGTAVLLWTEGTADTVKVQSARYTVNSFGGVDTVDTDAVVGDVEVAVNKDGVAAAAYVIHAGIQGYFVTGSRIVNGAWDNPSTLSVNGEDSTDPVVGIDGANKVVVAWRTASAKLQVATRAPLADWADAVNVSTPSMPNNLVVAMNNRGDVGLQWSTNANALHLATRAKGASSFHVAGIMTSNPLLTTNRGLAIDAQGNLAAISAISAPNATGRVIVRVYDMVGPTAKITKPVPPRVNATKIPVAWKGIDRFSAIASYDVQVKSAAYNGGFGPLALLKNDTAAKSTTYAGKQGRTYCFRATATDAAANTGAPSAFRCTTTPLDDRKPAAKGFAKKIGPGYFLGTFRQATGKGSTLTLTGVQVRTLSLLVAKGPGHGTIAVFFNGNKLGTYSLAAAKTKLKQQLLVKKFAAVKKGTLVIKVVSSGKPVRIDGIHVTR